MVCIVGNLWFVEIDNFMCESVVSVFCIEILFEIKMVLELVVLDVSCKL